MKHLSWLLWVALLAGAACGGNVDQREEESAGAAGSSSTAAATEEAEDPNTRRLGQCEPGFDPLDEPGKECLFLGDDGLCYKEVDDACDCVCPRNSNSTCFSGYLGSSDTQEVWCQ